MLSLATIVALGGALGGDLSLWVKLLPATFSTLLVGWDLTVRLTDKAWLHADLVRQFTDLERRLERGRSVVDEDLLVSVADQRLEIEAAEPTGLRVLDTICHNELLRAMGYPQERHVKVGFWQRLFAHFFDIREQTLQTP